MSKPARISPMKHYGRDGVLLQYPYEPDFNETLKAMFPRRDVWFNQHRKGWWIAVEHVDSVTHLMRNRWGTVEIEGVDGRKVTLTPAGETLVQEELL